MAVTNKANITAVMGGSGSGKSAFIKREIARIKPKRMMIFDVMHEYGDLGQVVTTCADLARLAKGKSFRLIFQPSSANMQRQFDFFCKLAFEIGDLLMGVEELNRVTQANKAPPAWQDCTSRGRHKGLIIYGASQRPASVDKDFFSNATKIRTGRLNFEADIKSLSNVIGCSQLQIKMFAPLEFAERDMQTGKITYGKLNF